MFKVGCQVVCIDATPYEQWAAWFLDDDYTNGLLVEGQIYTVLGVLYDTETEQIGLDIGVPLPDGSNPSYWNSWRFTLVDGEKEVALISEKAYS